MSNGSILPEQVFVRTKAADECRTLRYGRDRRRRDWRKDARPFGLAQLHQLRGRVGRGSEASSCILLYSGKLSQNAEARLKIMRETEDGFLIAEEDLRLRGEGELLGTKQSGTPGFAIASLEAHGDLLEIARKDSHYLLDRDPELQSPRGEAIRTLLYLFRRDEAVRFLKAG